MILMLKSAELLGENLIIHFSFVGKHSCGPIDHSKLEEVLRQTKADVFVAFANDFDTPTAMIHVTNLVHEGVTSEKKIGPIFCRMKIMDKIYFKMYLMDLICRKTKEVRHK